ncbi:MAG TPA: hypothetical protein VFJ90_11315 [Candidatus Didemnitutus sp.]|nr:hypothetical protein [Candidatus Didemnitutus sp.]
MLPALYSLQFRVHTRVLVTLLVAIAITVAMYARPATVARPAQHSVTVTANR